MADLKISQLTAGGTAQTTDIFPIARGSVNYSLSMTNVLDLIATPYVFTALRAGTITSNTLLAAVDNAQITGTATAQLRIAGNSGVIGSASLDISQDSTGANIVQRAVTPLSVGTNGASALAFKTNSVTRMTISSDGTSITMNSPSGSANQSLYLGYGANGDVLLSLGEARTNSGYASITLKGQASSVDGLTIQRLPGANASSVLTHYGTGSLTLNAINTGQISLSQAGTAKFYVGTDGYSYAITPSSSDNSTKVATTAFANNAGVGSTAQSWIVFWYVTVTSSTPVQANTGVGTRTMGTTLSGATAYSNTTSRPIMVNVEGYDGARLYLYASSSATFNETGDSCSLISAADAVTGSRPNVTGIIPAGWYYKVVSSNTTVTSWCELR